MIKLKYKPVKGPLVISSKYGIRVFGGLEFHPGIDYKAPLGEPIFCVADGKVTVAWNDPSGYGLYVVVEHSGYCTLYAHLREHILTTGQSIKAGDVIGYVGLTGMTTGPHLHFEIRDCLYSNTNFWLKSTLKGRHVMCIDPEELVKEADEVPRIDVRYKKYSDRIHELRGEVKDFGIKVVKKSNRSIEEPYCTNGTFQWWEDVARKKPYPTSILYFDGKVYQASANHLPCPQSVYITYKNDTVDLKRIKNLSELNLDNIKQVVGGVGIRNVFDSTFKYSPVTEGFSGAFADVLARSDKTFIGYNKRLNKQYLLVLKNVTMAEAIAIMTDNSTGEAYDIILMLDGGGSSFLNNLIAMIVYGDGRYIHHIIGFGL